MAMLHSLSAFFYSSTISKNNVTISIPPFTNTISTPHRIHTSNNNNNNINNKWRITSFSTRFKRQDFICKDNINFSDDFCARQAKNMSEVRQKLIFEEESLEALLLIDAVKRIGIDYHFTNEIDAFLEKEYKTFVNSATRELKYRDFFDVSLSFRLLREQGYYVSADVFNIFTDKDGKIKQNLQENRRALMGLYEASQLCIEGENVLEVAGNSCEQLLKSLLSSRFLNDNEAMAVRDALLHTYHKCLAKFTGKNFLRQYINGPNGYKSTLQELAKVDFDMAHSIHQKELVEILRWWNDMGLAKEMKLARDQPVKWYTWPMAALSDPSLSKQRIELTKPISLIYIIDDIFDVYGTLDQLTLFTKAVNGHDRWNYAGTEQLPDYMKICLKALYDITHEIGYKIYMEYGWNPINSLQKAWASLLNAFLVEANWFASGHVPTAAEYLNNGIISSGMHVVLVHLFFILGEGRTKESENIVDDTTGIFTSVAEILRLSDDLGSAKDENQSGHDGSYITCYMKEHEGSTVEIARQEVNRKISEAWKRLNKACLSPNPFSPTFRKASINLARMVPLMYNYDENQGLQELDEYIKRMLDI